MEQFYAAHFKGLMQASG